jgi:hypothetical protein
MSDWVSYSDGLPLSISTCILRPFYRDQKLRLGAYGKGVWEAPFVKPSRPVAQPMVNKRETSCPGDTLQFDDFSMLQHEGATWSWQFPGGIPASSTLRNPRVVYNATGIYDVTLTVTAPLGRPSTLLPAARQALPIRLILWIITRIVLMVRTKFCCRSTWISPKLNILS